MKRSRFSEEQIIAILKEQEAGMAMDREGRYKKAGGFSLDLIKALAEGLTKKIERHTAVDLDI